jgi:protein-disulfide isomerase
MFAARQTRRGPRVAGRRRRRFTLANGHLQLAGSIVSAVLVSFVASIAPATAEAPSSSPLAEVNGDVITQKDLEQAAGAQLSRMEEQLYDLKRRELDALIADRLFAQEAKKRGVSVSALLDAEITSKVALVTEQEIDSFMQANRARLRADDATVRQQVRARLQQQKLLARRDEFVESLRAKSNVVVKLAPPPVIRMDVATQGAPVRGPADAPVTLVEFSDFQCPFCKQSQATLKQILARYPGKVKLVYRDFPLDQLHPDARAAAEAARCAGDQGKFWEYHDIVYAHAPQEGPDALRGYAQQAGLDVAAFDRCVSSGTHRAGVQQDVEAGTKLGITGTPAFFVNGRPVLGAQPLEAFARVIDEELTKR